MYGFSESRFENQVEAAVHKIRTILHQLRQPTIPAEVSHQYDDKYLMVDFLTNTALASYLNCFELLGVDDKALETMLGWSKNRSVTFRLAAEETCSFDRKEKRKIEGPTTVTETKGVFGKGVKKEKVVAKVTDYFWKFTVSYEFFVYKGNNPNEKITFLQRTGTYEIKTSTEDSPKPKTSVQSPIDYNITWLLSKISGNRNFCFHIKRENPRTCRTPRRNPDVEEAMRYTNGLYNFASQVNNYFKGRVFPVQEVPKLDVSKINDSDIFIPVVPLFEDQQTIGLMGGDDIPESKCSFLVTYEPSASSSDVVLPPRDLCLFLDEQIRGLREKFSEFDIMFPNDGKLITAQEARIVLVFMNIMRACQHFLDGVEYVEFMLRTQLISAIGKEVTAVDFANYMNFHNRKIFRENYQPQPFSYAIRQPDRFPEGVFGIDIHLSDGSVATPINTTVRHGTAIRPMRFSVSAATEIEFYGDRYLHAYVGHQFSSSEMGRMELVARARQWSSFVLMVGTIGGLDVFEPKHAIIVQNKDDLVIPLLLEKIPTPKAFKDAIESLSPEQQRFAKAYRSMQLSGTVFGVCILQVRPQLEKLMKLPADSLTKEIRLTQDLMELLIKYQIPSDLLSFGGDPLLGVPETPGAEKLQSVKNNVEALHRMIDEIREKELSETREKKAHFKILDSEDRYLLREAAIDYASDQSVLSTQDLLGSLSGALVKNCFASTGGMADDWEDRNEITPDMDGEGEATGETETPAGETPEKKDEVPKEKEVVKIIPEKDDYSKIPAILDKKFEKLDLDGAVRATIIKPSPYWTRTKQASLLSTPVHETLDSGDQESEKKKAFDLVEALSRSGGLSFDQAELHVVLASTHCFDQTLINTVVQDNINPIEKLERTMLIVATTVHQQPASVLVKPEHCKSVETFSSNVFEDSAALSLPASRP